MTSGAESRLPARNATKVSPSKQEPINDSIQRIIKAPVAISIGVIRYSIELCVSVVAMYHLTDLDDPFVVVTGPN